MTQQVCVVRRFGLVCLAGLLGGAFSKFVYVLHLGNAETWTNHRIEYLQYSAVFGGSLGGAFGVVAFPICYYLFLRNVPLRTSLLATVPAMIIFDWLGMPLLSSLPFAEDYRLALFFIPGFLGLLLSSIALNRFAPKVVERV